jgi:segregation and condensation protein B
VEALLFAAAEPMDERALASALPAGTNVGKIVAELQRQYEARGVNLVKIANKWQLRTANDLAFLMRKQAVEERRLSRAAIETLAIVAYHQPVTRAEIEDIRGVMVSKGTIDALMEAGWVRIRGRKRTPGRPVTYGTTEAFLTHFGWRISAIFRHGRSQSPDMESVPPAGTIVPNPSNPHDEDPRGATSARRCPRPPRRQGESGGNVTFVCPGLTPLGWG